MRMRAYDAVAGFSCVDVAIQPFAMMHVAYCDATNEHRQRGRSLDEPDDAGPESAKNEPISLSRYSAVLLIRSASSPCRYASGYCPLRAHWNGSSGGFAYWLPTTAA